MCRPPSLSQILARTASNVQHCTSSPTPQTALMYLNYSESCPTFTTTIRQRAVSRPASAHSSQSSFYIRSSHEALRARLNTVSQSLCCTFRSLSKRADYTVDRERHTRERLERSNRTRNTTLREMMEERKKK